MDYVPTLGEKWPHSRGNVGKYSLHGASGNGNQLLLIYATEEYPGRLNRSRWRKVSSMVPHGLKTMGSSTDSRPWTRSQFTFRENRHMSNEENPGWLGYIGDYTTQLYRGL